MSEEELKYFKGLIGFTFDSDDIRYIEKIVDKKDKEIERLNNIINELEKWLKEAFDRNESIYELYKDDMIHHTYEINNARYQNNIFNAILNKLNELKGDSSNE